MHSEPVSFSLYSFVQLNFNPYNDTAPFWTKLPVSVHGWPSSCVKLHQIAFYSRLVAERIILMIIVSVPQNSLLGVFLIIFIVLCCWIIMTPVTRYRLYCKAVGKVILSSPSLLLWIIIVIVFRCGCTSYLLARCDPILLIVSCCRLYLSFLLVRLLPRRLGVN